MELIKVGDKMKIKELLNELFQYKKLDKKNQEKISLK